MHELNPKEKSKVIPFMQDGSFFYKKGIEAYQNHQIDQSINYIEKAIRIEPDEPIFLCQLAIVLSEKGRYQESNDWLYKVINDIDDSMSECYFLMANNFAYIGEFELAKQRLKKYLKMDPNGEFAEDASSLLYMLEEEQLEDIEDMAYFSQTPSPLENIVDLLNKGEYEWAEKEARGFIMENPQAWDGYAYLAESLMEQGDLAQAKSILQDLLIKEEPNFLARCIYTNLLTKENDAEAATWVENLLNLRPLKYWDRYNLGRTLYFLGEYDQAYKCFEKLALVHTKEFKRSPAFFHQMAILAYKNGKHEKARQLWEVTRNYDNEENIAESFLHLLAKDYGFLDEQMFFLYKEPKSLLETTE